MQNKILSIYGYYMKKVRKRTYHDNISHWEVYERVVVGQDRTLKYLEIETEHVKVSV